MALIPDATTFQKRLAALPLRTYQAGEVVFPARSKTGQLLILKNGVVAIVKEDVEIAKVGEPGAVFGELSALLDQPHTADVRAVEISQFYIAATLARRLNSANQVLVDLKNQVETGQPRDVLGKTLEKIEGLLGPRGASLVYAGYPSDPYS